MRREWVKMEYANTVRDQPYVVGSVQELAGVGWTLLHCASKTAVHENSPSGVDLGTLAYMRAEGIANYAVHIADTFRWLVVKLEQLELGQQNENYHRKGVVFGSGVVRNRVYLPWVQWISVVPPVGWKRITTSDIPYRDETRITEDGAVKWRSAEDL